MSKKIFDIIPPHLLQNKHAKTNAKKSKDNKKMKNKAEKKDGKKISGKLKGVLVLFGILLVFGGVYLYFKLAFLTVEIWPAVEAVNFEQEIKIEESLEEIDLENKK
ncbi:hypothetical protein KKC00_00875, partial [Patescibacteria group bacterium]|nr:hypothetical protein [Patescibacteria group bacterium]